MTTLIWIYIGLYVLVAAVIVLVETHLTPPEERDPGWESAADVLLLLLGLAGMLLFQLEVESAALTATWRVVAPLLVLAHIALSLRGRRRVVEEEAPPKSAVFLNDLATLAFLGPSLVLNLLYAYGVPS